MDEKSPGRVVPLQQKEFFRKANLMAGILGINSSAINNLYSSVSSSQDVSTNLVNGAKILEAILENEGIDEETRKAIQEELAAAIKDMLTASDGKMPTPEEMKSTIDGILAEHDLDAEQIMAQARGSAPVGLPLMESSEESQNKTLFDILAEADKENANSDASEILQTANELSQLIMDYLIGINEEA